MGSGMNVCVLGLGYIGLPTAAMMALAGHQVVGYDVDARVLRALEDGASHVKEEPVRALVLDALRSGKLTLASEIPAASEAYIICVPTPTIDHKPDLSFVQAASAAVAPLLNPGDLIVVESTVPPGHDGPRRRPRAARGRRRSRLRRHRALPRARDPRCDRHRAARERARRRRPQARRRRARAHAVRELHDRRDQRYGHRHGRAGEGHREHVPRRQHRVRERARAAERGARRRRPRGDRAREPASARQHPFAGSRRRRPLHPGRSALPLEREPVRHRADPNGAAHQRAHAARRRAAHRRARRGARRRDASRSWARRTRRTSTTRASRRPSASRSCCASAATPRACSTPSPSAITAS